MDDRDGKSDLWNESADDIEEDSPDYETEYDRLVDTSTKIFVDGADDDKYDLVLGDAKEEKKEGEEDGIGDTTASVDRAGAESEADEVDLKAFPDPMLDTDGLAVVVGDAAEGSDVVGAIDIATSLTEDMAAVPGGVSGVTLPEDVGQVGDVSDLDNIPASVHRPPAWKQPRAWSIGVGGALLATIVIIYAFVNDETPTASNPPPRPPRPPTLPMPLRRVPTLPMPLRRVPTPQTWPSRAPMPETRLPQAPTLPEQPAQE